MTVASCHNPPSIYARTAEEAPPGSSDARGACAGLIAFCSILAGSASRASCGWSSLRTRCSVTTDKSAAHEPPAS
eukprot:scaffold1112_cov116-Isochrysis_galbana.AAC.4